MRGSTNATRPLQVRLDRVTRQAWEEAAGDLPLSVWIRSVIAQHLGREELLIEGDAASAGRALRAARGRR